MRNFKKKIYIGAILLTLFSLIAFAAGVKILEVDKLQIGQPSSGSDKELIFDTGDGASNKKLVIDDTTKDASLNSNNFTLGDGADTDKKYILDLGLGAANPFLIYNSTTDKWRFANTGAGSETDFGAGGGAPSVDNDLTTNPDFETNTAAWTNNGGGTFSRITSPAADIAFGIGSATFDAAASTDNIVADQVAIPPGMRGKCEAKIVYKDGDALLDFEVFDGSVALVTKTLATSAEFTNEFVNFDCPTSGTIGVRIIATGNAASIIIDNVFVGQVGFTNKPVVNDVEGIFDIDSIYTTPGQTGKLKFVSAYINQPTTITTEFGNWLDSASSGGGGLTDLIITAGVFINAPFCWTNDASSNADACANINTLPTNALVKIQGIACSTGALTNQFISLYCMGE